MWNVHTPITVGFAFLALGVVLGIPISDWLWGRTPDPSVIGTLTVLASIIAGFAGWHWGYGFNRMMAERDAVGSIEAVIYPARRRALEAEDRLKATTDGHKLFLKRNKELVSQLQKDLDRFAELRDLPSVVRPGVRRTVNRAIDAAEKAAEYTVAKPSAHLNDTQSTEREELHSALGDLLSAIDEVEDFCQLLWPR